VDDLAMGGEQLNTPLLLYCQSVIAERMMMPQRAEALRAQALNASGNSVQVAYETGIGLADCGWSDLALPQLNAYLAMAANMRGGDYLRAEAELRLATIYARAGDYKNAAAAQGAVAKFLESGPASPLNNVNPDNDQEYPEDRHAIDVHLHLLKLKAAQGENDASTGSEELDALVKLDPDDPDVVEYIVPLLKAQHRDAEAGRLFDHVYALRRGPGESGPSDAFNLNNLAWFCAKCGERLEEADSFARRAVAAAPNVANYIDTLAECEYCLGRPQEAVRLDSIAVSLDRGDFSRIQQLDRFRAAAAQESH
jgi:tetratricopeptide (TPR) repeat protein